MGDFRRGVRRRESNLW